MSRLSSSTWPGVSGGVGRNWRTDACNSASANGIGTSSRCFLECPDVWSAELVRRAGLGIAGGCFGDGMCHIADEHRLEPGLAAANQPQERRNLGHRRKAIEELVFWSNMIEGRKIVTSGASSGCCAGDRAGAPSLHGTELLLSALEQDADQIDDDCGVAYRGFDHARDAHVCPDGFDLPWLAELPEGEVGTSHRYAQAVLALGQCSRHMPAEES